MASETKEDSGTSSWRGWSRGMTGESFVRNLVKEEPDNFFVQTLEASMDAELAAGTPIPASPAIYMHTIVKDLVEHIQHQIQVTTRAIEQCSEANVATALLANGNMPYAHMLQLAEDLRDLDMDWDAGWSERVWYVLSTLLGRLKTKVNAMCAQNNFIVRRVLTRLRRPRNRYAHGNYVGQRSENPRDAVPVPPAPLPTTVHRRDPEADHEDENGENENAPFHPYRPLQGADPGALSGMGLLDTWANKAIFKGNVEKILASPEYRSAKKHFIEHRTKELMGPAQKYIGLVAAGADRVLPGSGRLVNKAVDSMQQAMRPEFIEDSGSGFEDDPTIATVTNDWVQAAIRRFDSYDAREVYSLQNYLNSLKDRRGILPSHAAHVLRYSELIYASLLDHLLDEFDPEWPTAEKRLRFVRKVIEVFRPTDAFEADFLRFLNTRLQQLEAAVPPHARQSASASSDASLAGQKRPRGMGFDVADSAPSSGIAQQEAVALSGQQVTHDAGGGIRVVRYPDLSKFASWQDLVNTPHKAAAILFLTTSEHSGHWICAFEGPDGAHVFDPLGLALDAERFKISSAARSELNENTPQLQRLLDSSKEPIHVSRMDFQKNAPNINTCGRWVATRLQYRNLTDEAFQALVAAGVRSARCTPDEWVTAHTESGGAPVHAALGAGIRDSAITDRSTRQHVLMRHLYKIQDGPDAFKTHSALRAFTKAAHPLSAAPRLFKDIDVRGGAIPKKDTFAEYYLFCIGIFECMIQVFEQKEFKEDDDDDDETRRTFVFRAAIAPEYVIGERQTFTYSNDKEHFRGASTSHAQKNRSSLQFYKNVADFEAQVPIADLERVFNNEDDSVTVLGPSKLRQDSIRWNKARIDGATVNYESFPMCVIVFKQTGQNTAGENTAIMSVGCNIHDTHSITKWHEPTGIERGLYGDAGEFRTETVVGLSPEPPLPDELDLQESFEWVFSNWLKQQDVATDDTMVKFLRSTPKDADHLIEASVDTRAAEVPYKTFKRIDDSFCGKNHAIKTLLLRDDAYASTRDRVVPFTDVYPQVNELTLNVPLAGKRFPVIHTPFSAPRTTQQDYLQKYIHIEEFIQHYDGWHTRDYTRAVDQAKKMKENLLANLAAFKLSPADINALFTHRETWRNKVPDVIVPAAPGAQAAPAQAPAQAQAQKRRAGVTETLTDDLGRVERDKADFHATKALGSVVDAKPTRKKRK